MDYKINKKYKKRIIKFAEGLNLNVTCNGGSLLILDPYQDYYRIILTPIEDNVIHLYLYYRFRSWHALGDRTDLLEIFTLIHTFALRTFSYIRMSCRFYNQLNPATGEEVSLYGRFILFEQPNDSIINLDSDISSFENLLSSIFVNSFLRSLIFQHDCKEKSIYDFQDEKLLSWVGVINAYLGVNSECLNHTYNLRTNPDWFYYRNIEYGISIIKSEELSLFFRHGMDKKEIFKKYEGVASKLFTSDDISNSVSNEKIKFCADLIVKLENSDSNINYIPLENVFICFGLHHITILEGNFGRDRYNIEKKELLQRHQKEAEFLYNEREIIWRLENKVLSSEIFENLVLDLIKVEPNIVWARKVAPTNQPDNGRDLICERSVVVSSSNEESLIFNKQKIIVQCKSIMSDSKKKT